jgi:hypothetical protein
MPSADIYMTGPPTLYSMRHAKIETETGNSYVKSHIYIYTHTHTYIYMVYIYTHTYMVSGLMIGKGGSIRNLHTMCRSEMRI